MLQKHSNPDCHCSQVTKTFCNLYLKTGKQHVLPRHEHIQSNGTQQNQDRGRHYLSERTSETLLTMPFSRRVGNSTATVLWAAEPVDSHIRVQTWTRQRESVEGQALGYPHVYTHTKKNTKHIHIGQSCDKHTYLAECFKC